MKTGDEIKYIGHRINSGGLQGHSIGDQYPLAVVGCLVARLGDSESTSESTRYYVLNCATGERFVRLDGETFNTSAHAHCLAAGMAEGWITGRRAVWRSS
jgi:hypothetical protein